MRGGGPQQGAMWSTISSEERVPQDHPLRPIREMVNVVAKDMSPSFSRIYAREGRPSIPPERLLRALLLQVLFSVRSERMLMERLNYNRLFRWFVGLNMDDAVWSSTTFSKNRERLIDAAIADKFFERVQILAREAGLLSDEHFTLDGTLIEGWVGHKSFKPKDAAEVDTDDPGNPTVGFHGQKRTNDTHRSTTDRESRLCRKTNGAESKLCLAGQVMTDNRRGLAVDNRLKELTGRSNREAGLSMLEGIGFRRGTTIGGDKGYDSDGAAQSDRWPCGAGTARRAARAREKLVEGTFGWLKTVAPPRKTRHRGKHRVGWMLVTRAGAGNAADAAPRAAANDT